MIKNSKNLLSHHFVIKLQIREHFIEFFPKKTCLVSHNNKSGRYTKTLASNITPHTHSLHFMILLPEKKGLEMNNMLSTFSSFCELVGGMKTKQSRAR